MPKTARQLDEEIAGYRVDRLRDRIKKLIGKWAPILGVRVRQWQVIPLKSYWASVDTSAGKIWFNDDLAAMPPRFVEVIVIHELVHFLTSGHDRKFFALMDQHAPGWRRLHAKYAPLEMYDDVVG